MPDESDFHRNITPAERAKLEAEREVAAAAITDGVTVEVDHPNCRCAWVPIEEPGA